MASTQQSSTSDGRVHLNIEEAISRLPDGDKIHTFRDGGICLIGADWDREDLIATMRENGVEESGPSAQAVHHGMVLFTGADPLFIETRQAESEGQG